MLRNGKKFVDKGSVYERTIIVRPLLSKAGAIRAGCWLREDRLHKTILHPYIFYIGVLMIPFL